MGISILVADDHEIIRAGVVALLKGTDIKIVAEAADAEGTVKAAAKHRPDVVLLDIRMPGDGFKALKQIRRKSPDLPVVVLSTHDNPTYVARCVAAGAADYVLKGSSRRDLIAAITAAAAGEGPTDQGEMKSVAAAMARRPVGDEDAPLTVRETQVVRHIALGLSNKEIAESLGISIETVKEHVQNILRKLRLSDRTQVAVWSVRRGMV